MPSTAAVDASKAKTHTIRRTKTKTGVRVRNTKTKTKAQPTAKPKGKKGGSHTKAIGRKPNPTTFGRILYACISNVKMSANQFARHVEMSSGFISGVYSGLKKPPLSQLKKWVKTLNLSSEQAAAFVLLAEMEHVKTHAPTIYTMVTTKTAIDVAKAEKLLHP